MSQILSTAPLSFGMMPDAGKEVCRVTCNGQIFEGWTDVAIVRDANALATRFRLSITEPTTASGKVLGWQIRPGDPIRIALGGKQVVDGFVDVRQASYDADSHGVQIDGRSRTGDLIEGAAVNRDGSPVGPFEGYTLDEIARSVLAPYSIGVKVIGDAGAPFARVASQWGESVFSLLERLSRLRGLRLTDDGEGNLVMTDGAAGKEAPIGLVEGRNILRATASMDVSQVASDVFVAGQMAGDDQQYGADVAQQSAHVANDKAPRYRPKATIMEQPGDKADMKARANQEIARIAVNQAQVQLVVQGWFTAEGDVWEPGMKVKLTSPMLLIDREMVVVMAQLTQSDGDGTTTELTLVTPESFAIAAPDQSAPAPQSEHGDDDPEDDTEAWDGWSCLL